MLSYEELGRDALDVITGNYFLKKFRMVIHSGGYDPVDQRLFENSG